MNLGVDAGNGAFKIHGPQGGLEILSQASSNGGQLVVSTMGLRKQKPPLAIQNEHGSFYIGAGAHNYGRPVENLDVERFNGTPEMVAFFHGAMTQYMTQYGVIGEPLTLIVGLPQETLTGDVVESTQENLRRWMRGQHRWSGDGKPFCLDVEEVKITSQVSGGLFDYLLDEKGKFIPERKKAFGAEVGVISVGFGTVELLVVQNRTPIPRFTAGTATGVRHLLEMVNNEQHYSLGEMDILLRAGQLDVTKSLSTWESGITGFINKKWGKTWRRFATVLILGGGAILLRNTLPQYFEGKGFMPDNPVQAIARSLYKMSLPKR